MLLYITWHPDPEIVHLPMLAPRWYGLLFALAFYAGYLVFRRIWLKEKQSEKSLDTLSWFVIIATLLGARLGHVLFYGPWWNEVDELGNVLVKGYFDNPLSILNIREGGLASHGAAIGILIALFLFIRKAKIQKSYLWLVDRLVIVVALGGMFVRMGNFANSEIVGTPTDASTGVVFAYYPLDRLNSYLVDQGPGLSSYSFDSKGDTQVMNNQVYQEYDLKLNYVGEKEDLENFILYNLNYVFNTTYDADRNTYMDNFQPYEVQAVEDGLISVNLTVLGLPRHPAQLYEAVSYLLLFFLLLWVYHRYGNSLKEGFIFGLFLVGLFSARFFIEFIKENQVDFESGLALNMGQNLSIPFIAIGLWLMARTWLPSRTKG
jgi:prolipoprotein diacylglyceryltransferase